MTDPLLEPEDYTSYGDTNKFTDDPVADNQTLNDIEQDDLEGDYSIKAWEQALSESLYNQQRAYELSKEKPNEPI